MLISLQHKFIFVHIPRVAGVSITTALSRAIVGRDFRTDLGGTKHLTLLQLQRYMHRKGYDWFDLNNFFKIGFVRNPWDRLVSLYHYLQQSGVRKDLIFESFEHFVRKLDRGDCGVRKIHSMRMQRSFLVDEQNEIIADFIGRFENLEGDYRQISTRFGFSEVLPKLNVATHGPYQDYYQDFEREFVSRTFKEDLEEFGYSFDSSRK